MMQANPAKQPSRAIPVQAASSGAPVPVFVVEILDEKYGLPIEFVRAVVRAENITPIPMAPYHYFGPLNLRGRVVTAIDLRIRLGRSKFFPAENILAVGVEYDGEDFAIPVDNVREVVELNPGEAFEMGAADAGAAGAFVDTIYNTKGGIISVLNVPKLLGFDSAA